MSSSIETCRESSLEDSVNNAARYTVVRQVILEQDRLETAIGHSIPYIPNHCYNDSRYTDMVCLVYAGWIEEVVYAMPANQSPNRLIPH
jgi:hypothetical protein